MKTESIQFPGRLALQQRVLPAYRVPFFDALAAACTDGLSIFAGMPLAEEEISVSNQLQVAETVIGQNRHLFDPNSPRYQCWQVGLLEWLERWQPKALVVEANPRYVSTPQAVRWMHARGRPAIGWGLGAPPITGWLASWRARRRRNFLSTLDAMIAYSHRGVEEYKAIGFPQEKVFVAQNAVTPRPATKPRTRPPEISGRATVLFVGRLQPRKRVDHLLKACAALNENLQPNLVVVGDGPAKEDLQLIAKSIYPQARFTGALFGAALDESFDNSDLFVLPGTGGLAVQQAMAHGLPVIVAQGDGTQDDLVRPENGWRIPNDDLAALTATLANALANPEGLRRKGEASFRIVDEEINVENMVQIFLQALSSVIDGK